MNRFYSSYQSVVLLLILGIGLSATLFSVTRQQTLRSDAASTAICSPIPQQEVVKPPSGGTPAVTQDSKTLQAQYDSLTSFSVTDKKALALKIRDTATNRKKRMLQVMRRDPEAALEIILSDKDRAELASVTTNCVENLKTVEGTLSIIHYDYEDSKTNEVYTLTTPDKTKYNLIPAGEKQQLQDSMKIRVEGYQLDSFLLVNTDENDTVDVLTPGIAQDIPSAQGQQNTLVLLTNFSNTQQPSLSQSTINSAVFTAMDDYFQETSYDQTSVTGVTRNWTTLAIPQSCDLNTVTGPMLTTAEDVVDQYTRFVIFAPFGTNCGWNGAGTIGKTGLITVNGQQVNISVSWINTTMYTGSQDWLTRVAAHEFAHNLGIHHATMPTCNCQQPEYGDPFTVMGKNQYGGSDTVVQLNAPHKEFIGWLDAQAVTTNGTFTLLPLSSQAPGLKAIKIPRGNGDFLYVEYRQPIGEDANIANINGTDAYEGALLHTILPLTQPATLKTELIDTTPNSSVPASALRQGTSFTDTESGATLQITGTTGNGLTVSVSFDGEQPTPTPTEIENPTPTLTQPANSPTPSIYGQISGHFLLNSNVVPTNFGHSATVENLTTGETQTFNLAQGWTYMNRVPGNYKITAHPVQSHTLSYTTCSTTIGSACSPWQNQNYTQGSEITIDLDENEHFEIAFKYSSAPTPTPTTIVDPCTGTSTCVRVDVSLLLHGIGAAGDNTNPFATGNQSPLRPNRFVMVELYDADEQLLVNAPGVVTYDTSTGEFSGRINIGDVPTNEQYIIKVWSDNYLTRRIPGIRTLSNTQTVTLPTVELITGDINNNNVLDILDYNALLLCYSGITFAQDCSNQSQFEEADLTDDGFVDRDDYTLFLRELLTREGD